MPNRQLSSAELLIANEILRKLRLELLEAANGDESLLFAYRRKIFKELTYDERGKPMHRRTLKARKIGEQRNRCDRCNGELPPKYAVLDRKDAMLGYTPENTRVICVECDTAVQVERNYR